MPWQLKFRQPLTRKSETFLRDLLTCLKQKKLPGVTKSQSTAVNSTFTFIVFADSTGIVTSPPRKYFWLPNCLRTCRLIYFADDYAWQRWNRTFSRNWNFYGLYWLQRTRRSILLKALPSRLHRKRNNFLRMLVYFYNLSRLAPFNGRKKRKSKQVEVSRSKTELIVAKAANKFIFHEWKLMVSVSNVCERNEISNCFPPNTPLIHHFTLAKQT